MAYIVEVSNLDAKKVATLIADYKEYLFRNCRNIPYWTIENNAVPKMLLNNGLFANDVRCKSCGASTVYIKCPYCGKTRTE